MKTLSNTTDEFESTYALIVRSEEKQRSRLETLLYTLLVASVLAAVSQFSREAAAIPCSIGRSSITTINAPHLSI